MGAHVAAKAIIVSTKPLDDQEIKLTKGWKMSCDAIEEIHDKCLYKLRGFESFKDYCGSGAGITRGRAYHLLTAVAQARALPGDAASLIANERASRALQKVPEDEQAELLKELSIDGAPVKARAIEEAVEAKVKPPKKNNDRAPKRKSAKVKTEKVVDKLGTAIKYEKVALAFNQASQINALIARTRALSKDIEELADETIGVHIPKQNLHTDMHNVQVALRHGLPFQVCPKCKGEGKSCTGCRTAGWITKTMHSRLSETK